MMQDTKRVAVIGAGVSGIMAIRALKEEGLDPVCYERTGDVGGLWCYHEADIDGSASVMKTTTINNSKELGACSVLPPPADYPNYMHHTKMHEYILLLATEGDCMRHIRHHHETKSIEKNGDYEVTGRWKVTNQNLQSGELVTEVFDCVCVCTGHHVYPNVPTFPRQEEFEGEIVHTHSLKKVDAYDNLRVAIVGVGNSGLDAAVDISAIAKQVYLSSNRGTWVLPRVGPEGLPYDAVFLRRYFFLLQRVVPYKLSCYWVERKLEQRFNHSLYQLKPKHSIVAQHPTCSDALPAKIISGTVKVRSGIKHFTRRGVVFDGEEGETEIDAVVLATGYKVKFPFLKEDIVQVVDNKVQLYKFIYPPELKYPTLAIVGLVQPQGPYAPIGEMQSRWISRIMSGKLSLPSKKHMVADIRKVENFNRRRYVNSPRHTVQVTFIQYLDDLASDIGAKPNLLKLAFTDPRLFWVVLTGPSLPYQYRLQGPHWWSGARDAILTYQQRVVAPFQKPEHHHSDKGICRFKKTLMKC